MARKIIIPRKYPLSKWYNHYNYDVNSYHIAVSCMQDKLKNHELEAEIFITDNYNDIISNRDSLKEVNKSNGCGYITEIADDYIVIQPKCTDIINLFLFYAQNGLKPNAYMRYKGEKSIFKNVKRPFVSDIITFDIVLPTVPKELQTVELCRILNKLKEFEGISSYIY